MIESNGWYGREERMKITTLLTVFLLFLAHRIFRRRIQ